MSLDSSEASLSLRIIVRNWNSCKNKVIDLHSWLLAWSLLLQIINFHGHLTNQLIKCQLFITQLATNYNFHLWYAYDQAFRLLSQTAPTLGGILWTKTYTIYTTGAHRGVVIVFFLWGEGPLCICLPCKRRFSTTGQATSPVYYKQFHLYDPFVVCGGRSEF